MSDHAELPNPYQPTAQTAQSIPVGLSEIPLAVSEVAFQGTLQRKDLSRALSLLGNYRVLLAMQLITLLALGGLLWLGDLAIVLLMVLSFTVLLLVLWQFSGWHQANLMQRRVPLIYRPVQGRITAQTIWWQTETGWGEVYWYGVAGIRVRDDVIAVALNSQHGSVLIFARRFFSAEDWQHLTNALTPLTRLLPFKPRRPVPGETQLLTAGAIKPLGDLVDALPGEAILFRGTVRFQDVMRSAYGHRLIVRFLVVALGWVLLPALGVGIASALFGVPHGLLLLMLIVPGLILGVRLVLVLWSTYGPKNTPVASMELAVADEGIWVSNPRGIGFSQWQDFGHVIFGKQALLLRQSADALSLVVLARHMLVDPQQWEHVCELVTTKVTVR